MPTWFVCIMGMGIVFAGLIALVFICWVLGLFCKNIKDAPVASAAPSAPVVNNSNAIPNKQELIAAISCAVAEDLGTDVSAIRITSIKKL